MGGGSGFASSGRGGAGNFVDSTKSPKLQPEDLQTPTLKTSVVTTGRGGSGNMAKNVDPMETRARQDVQPYVFSSFSLKLHPPLFLPAKRQCILYLAHVIRIGYQYVILVNGIPQANLVWYFPPIVSLVEKAKGLSTADAAGRATSSRARTRSRPSMPRTRVQLMRSRKGWRPRGRRCCWARRRRAPLGTEREPI